MIRRILAILATLTLSLAIAQGDITAEDFAYLLARDMDDVIVTCEVPWESRDVEATCIESWGTPDLARMEIDLALGRYGDVEPMGPWQREPEHGYYLRSWALEDENPRYSHAFLLIVDTSRSDDYTTITNVIKTLMWDHELDREVP